MCMECFFTCMRQIRSICCQNCAKLTKPQSTSAAQKSLGSSKLRFQPGFKRWRRSVHLGCAPSLAESFTIMSRNAADPMAAANFPLPTGGDPVRSSFGAWKKGVNAVTEKNIALIEAYRSRSLPLPSAGSRKRDMIVRVYSRA
jgi:hypothetical protein